LDLNEILTEIHNDLEVPIQQKNAVIKCNRLPTIKGVRVLIYQLLYNLINNSLKFAKESEAPRIVIDATITSVDGNPHTQIVIADNGIGFDPSCNETIFDTFTRLNSKTKYDGTGLGLSLSKKIVERHKGAIRASGIPNVGATFTIKLPL